MSALDCPSVRETIPDVVAGRLHGAHASAVEEHLSSCDDCRAEVALARALYATRASAPADLTEQIIEALRGDRRSIHRPWWAISAAAVAALALGIGITSGPSTEPLDAIVPEVAVESESSELWLAEDGFLAGAPVFETLSDEALEELLDELTPPSTGGQA